MLIRQNEQMRKNIVCDFEMKYEITYSIHWQNILFDSGQNRLVASTLCWYVDQVWKDFPIQRWPK